jgi:glutamine cyclotransferase
MTRTALVAAAIVMMCGVYRPVGFAAWQAPLASVPVYGYTVVNTYPHDRDSFTEGLFYQDGFMYEGTGLEGGRSYIRKYKLETGQVAQQHSIDPKLFGEGIVTWGSELFELTYTTGIGFVYDKNTFTQKRTFKYQGEGWALTKDKNGLIMSDGSDALRFLDPATLQERRPRLKITAASKPYREEKSTGTRVTNVNELEYVKGEILSNIWQQEYIARINPQTGQVTGWIDMRGLLTAREAAGVDVLNGIAYDEEKDRLFVTGKLWPKIFEIKITAPKSGR